MAFVSQSIVVTRDLQRGTASQRPRFPHMPQRDPIARAFELAKSGTCEDISAIRRQLSREGHLKVTAHFEGLAIKRQLRALIKATRPLDAPPPRKR